MPPQTPPTDWLDEAIASLSESLANGRPDGGQPRRARREWSRRRERERRHLHLRAFGRTAFAAVDSSSLLWYAAAVVLSALMGWVVAAMPI
jgi:hypothetical protein